MLRMKLIEVTLCKPGRDQSISMAVLTNVLNDQSADVA